MKGLPSIQDSRETERRIHEVAGCGVLRDFHDELDRLVAAAYGWPRPMEAEEILVRLVALDDERVEEAVAMGALKG